jgi:hypothetical protein
MTSIPFDNVTRTDTRVSPYRPPAVRRELVHGDAVFRVDPSTPPDYDSANPLLKLVTLMSHTRFAAERECYASEELQYLFPVDWLELYGPSGNPDLLDPTRQDEKTDFQKQNVRGFRLGDVTLVRGWATVGDLSVPFVRLSYRGGPDSRLSQAAQHRLGDRIQCWVRVGGVESGGYITLPYNEATDRYEVELWGAGAGDLRPRLDTIGRRSLELGLIQARPDLVRGGGPQVFQRDGLDGRHMFDVAGDHAMHPVLPLHVEAAFCDHTASRWDSQDGRNYHYEFNMILRGWDNYLGVGVSANPHGGVGFLEYRNLLSNYGRYAGDRELGRRVEPWSFDAFGTKAEGAREEPFMAVDYMDLHILRPRCGIGLHRHRDNQEAFLMMEGQGYMVVGDWCRMPERERCFEVRTLRAGHLALLKGGNLHGLMNPSDEDCSLFMFGGYD